MWVEVEFVIFMCDVGFDLVSGIEVVKVVGKICC